MQCSPDDIRIRRGDTRQIDILVDEVNGTPSSIGGAEVRWSYGPSPTRMISAKTEQDAEVSIVDVTVNGVARKAVRRVLTTTETMTLKAFETYYFVCRLTFGDAPETVESGTFLVEPYQGDV